MIINMISGPRNVSTALMYSFAQRDDTHVIDEPFYAVYLSQTGADHPGKATVLQAQPTDVEQVMDGLGAAHGENEHLFIKNMAHHLQYVPACFLQEKQNVFLIRDPWEMILSFIKKIPEPTLSDTAYRHQFELFEYASHELKQQPVVIDSAELLKNPAFVLQKVCETLDIAFDTNMLKWKPGPLAEDGVWAEHWYGSVHKSTGFEPYKPKNESFPDRLQPLLKKCQKFYKPLYKQAIKAPVD